MSNVVLFKNLSVLSISIYFGFVQCYPYKENIGYSSNCCLLEYGMLSAAIVYSFLHIFHRIVISIYNNSYTLMQQKYNFVYFRTVIGKLFQLQL